MSSTYTRNTKPSYTPPEPVNDIAPGIRWDDINWDRVLAGAIWLLAVFFTYRSVQSLFVAPLPTLPIIVGVIIAALFQAVCTKLEGPIWRPKVYDYHADRWYRRPATMANIVFLFMDAVVNASGVWIVVQNAHKVNFIIDFAVMLGRTTQPIRGPRALALCLALGLLVCAVPERLWYDDEYEVIRE